MFKINPLYTVHRIAVNVNVYKESALLEFKVPLIYLGTEGWVFRHIGRDGGHLASKSFPFVRYDSQIFPLGGSTRVIFLNKSIRVNQILVGSLPLLICNNPVSGI